MPDPGETEGHRLPAPAGETLRRSDIWFTVSATIQIILSILVLAISVGLLATLPPKSPAPSPISFAVFTAIFSILGWIFLLLISQHLNEKHAKVVNISAVVLTLIFFLTSSLIITVAIAPAQSCDDLDYIQENKLLVGSSPSRCRLIQADTAFIWLGISSHTLFQHLAFACYLGGATLRMYTEWNKADNALIW